MPRRIRWGRARCPICGEMITKNALGRAAHIRHCAEKIARFDKARKLIEGQTR